MCTFKGEKSTFFTHSPKFLNTKTKHAERKPPLYWSILCFIVNSFIPTSIISWIYALLLVQRHSHQSSFMLPYSWPSKEPTSAQASNFRSRWIPFLHPTLKSNQEAIFVLVMSTTVKEFLTQRSLASTPARYSADFTWIFTLLWRAAYPILKHTTQITSRLQSVYVSKGRAGNMFLSFDIPPQVFLDKFVLDLYRSDMVSVAKCFVTLRRFRQRLHSFLALLCMVHSFETHKFNYQLLHKPRFHTPTCFGHLLHTLYLGKS
jgi:hypothetical protein